MTAPAPPATPAEPAALAAEAARLLQDGQAAAARDLLQDAAAIVADHAFAWCVLGAAQSRLGEDEAAIAAMRQAVLLAPGRSDFHYNLGAMLGPAGDLAGAEAALRRCLELDPGHARAWQQLGTVLARRPGGTDAPAAAEAAFLQAVQLDGTDPLSWSNLAAMRRKAGNLTGAVAACRQAVAHAPDHPDLLRELGAALVDAGTPDEAVPLLRRAVALDPASAKAWASLGYALWVTRGRGEAGKVSIAAAASAFRQALSRDSGNAAAWHNLGALCLAESQEQKGIACLRQAIEIDPDFALAHSSLAGALRNLGEVGQAIRSYDRAQRLDPEAEAIGSSLIFTLDFDTGQTTASQQQARRVWAERFARPAELPPPRPAADPGRRLRIGYVSGDFRAHSAAATFAAPLLHRDPDAFHVTCYYTDNAVDEVTRRIRGTADRWRDVAPLDHGSLARQIREDAIDILVDLSGHTAGNRLAVFARRPAPVQVTGWGHCTGTGLAQIDALMADPVLIPPAERPLFAERIIDLPCALSFDPKLREMPEPAPADGGAQAARPVTFGALGRGGKVGPDAVRLWSAVLRAVPGSRLYLKDRQYEERLRQRQLRRQLGMQGIDPGRIAFQGSSDWKNHLSAYRNIDIALDTTPQGGGVTTLEALWMGVPVISLYGRFPSSRIAASILSACGHADWLAPTADGFVAIALRLAGQVPEIRAGRAAMRARLARMPPYDAQSYAAAVDRAYRRLWHDWCARQAGGSQL